MQGLKITKKYLIQICCLECGIYFCICRKCHKGQCYCSDKCRRIGYRKKHRKAQKKYRESGNGKEKRRIYAQKYRYREWLIKRKFNKKKIYSKLQIEPAYSNVINTLKQINRHKLKINSLSACHFCGWEGFIIEKFPRRGYG